MSALAWRERIAAVDEAAGAAARARIDCLTKPVGSLGRMEELAVTLCAIAGGIPAHRFERRTVLIGAGDHGIADEGVSAYPSEVTAQMVGGFAAGFAAISAFARTARAAVLVADFGVRSGLPPHPALIAANVGPGTRNFAHGPAMTRDLVERALEAGAFAFAAARELAPFDVLAIGEMGIGNTTSAAAIIAAFTGKPPREVAGRGTGIDDARLEKKIAVIERALARCADFTWDEIAMQVGGFEIVGLAGVILAAAAERIPVVLDGVIVAAAALIAGAIAPQALGYCIAAHRSQEPGHRLALEALGLRPLFDLELRLGEASGACLALPFLEAATRMIAEMKTFEEAGVATAEVAAEAAR